MTPESGIDIDVRPDITESAAARVCREGTRPVLMPLEPSRWLAALTRLLGKADECPVTVTFSRAKRVRSLAANAYLWAVVYPDLLAGLRALAQDAGERCPFASVDELHEAMKYRFLGVEVVRVAGVEVERPATTTTLTSGQFSEYVSQIKALAATWAIYIRESGESLSV